MYDQQDLRAQLERRHSGLDSVLSQLVGWWCGRFHRRAWRRRSLLNGYYRLYHCRRCARQWWASPVTPGWTHM